MKICYNRLNGQKAEKDVIEIFAKIIIYGR